ncbi:hypothetical protein D3C86_1510340 [compost metagenome]
MNRARKRTVNIVVAVDWVTQYVKYTTQCCCTNRYSNCCASICCYCATNKSISRGHCYATNEVVTKVNSRFNRHSGLLSTFGFFNFDCIQNFRELSAFELNVDDRPCNIHNAPFAHGFPPK